VSIVKLKALDGADIAFEDSVIIGSGSMKDVYFAPDRSYVVGFFRSKQDYVAKERLQLITGRYRDGIFNGAGSEFWKSVYCWPKHVVEHQGKLGVVTPTYNKHFFFDTGSVNQDQFKIKGKEKEGKWFASALHQGQTLDPKERGNWLAYIRISLNIARAVRRMHAAGLAHSDLSYKNVLVDPVTGSANIIDIDGLVVPGRFPPDVIGTPDFVAPEVMRTMQLKPGDPAKALPRRETDQHALAVLIYMYLLYRHPLRGRKVWDPDDSALDDALAMGEKALFIEHDQDTSNRPNCKWLEANYGAKKLPILTPYMDPDALPYTALGPYLAALFKQSFVDGLHDPMQRPGAVDFETALVKTADMVLNCSNPTCPQKYFVYDNSKQPRCSFCKSPYGKTVPIFDLYQNRGAGRFTPDNHRLVGYHNQHLFKWHANTNVWPNEKLELSDRQPIGYVHRHQYEDACQTGRDN
jgi:serine/threonine protein kinase